MTAKKEGNAGSAENASALHLYHYTNDDDDGEYGIIRAKSPENAAELLAPHFRAIYGEGETFAVSLMQFTDSTTAAVLSDAARQTITVHTGGEAHDDSN